MLGERRRPPPERVLPLRSGSTDVEFEFSVTVLQKHPDFTVEPLSGLVPAAGEAAIVFTFTPSRMANWHPLGSCAATHGLMSVTRSQSL